MSNKLEKTPIIDLHPIIEGEGSLMGCPAIMIRVSGCNLSCMFDNSICDTAYSSFCPEKGKYTLADVDKMIKDHPFISTISLSGGEPCLYPELIVHLKKAYPDHYLLVETNGTVMLSKEVYKCVDLFSISPKLSGATPTKEKCEANGMEWNNKMRAHDILRQNLDPLATMIAHSKDFQLKYVISEEDDLKEAEIQINTLMIIDYLRDQPKDKVTDYLTKAKETQGEYIPEDFKTRVVLCRIWLMPSGITREHLDAKRQWLMEKCIEKGFNYSDRLHIVAYGNKREA